MRPSRVAGIAFLACTLMGTTKANAQAAAHESPASGACDAAWVGRVYRDSVGSVVRVETADGASGAGFLFLSSSYVATAFHVASSGRQARVEVDGGVVDADVVAWDAEHDVAILQLASPARARPLEPAAAVGVGDPVIAIGHPYGRSRGSPRLEGLLSYSVSQGIVSAKNDTFVQTDTPLHPGNSGGPLLDCEGHVVGVASWGIGTDLGFAVSVARLVALERDVGSQGAYTGRWTIEWPVVGGVANFDSMTWLGAFVGDRLVGYDRIQLDLRLGALVATNSGTPVDHQSGTRFFGEVAAGYRLLLFPYTSNHTFLTLSAGAAFSLDFLNTTRVGIGYDDPTCPGEATCVPKLVTTTSRDSPARVLPMLSAGLLTWHPLPFELSYALMVDPKDTSSLTHRVLLGFFL